LERGESADIRGAFSAVSGMMGVLGFPLAANGSARGADAQALATIIGSLISQRAEARAAKDWAAADRIRDLFADAGVALEDTPDGTIWSIDG
ncbi:MAG: CysS/YqeB C-terminal domain-containing protein, partial [Microbacterium gubbeenense]